jgi:hypothetical protein
MQVEGAGLGDQVPRVRLQPERRRQHRRGSVNHCEHTDIEIAARMEHCQAGAEEWLSLALNVRCAGCNVLFSWGGLSAGLPNPAGPVVSADGYELRAPLAPRPGSVVGILQRAGLERVLQADTPWPGQAPEDA